MSVSVPTKCLKCSLIVEMKKGEDAWICPHCGKLYPFTWWKIRERKPVRKVKR